MKKSLSIILFLGSWVAQAQDYVVTLKNDTLKGVAKISDYDVIDRIDLMDQKKKNHFTAIQVRTLFMNREIFNPIRTDDGYRMMKLAKAGYLSLYKGRRPNSSASDPSNYDVSYLIKRGGSVIELPNLTFKKAMIDFLKDCNIMKEKIEKENLGKKDLDQIITDYNNCIENQTHPTPIALVSSSDPTLIALGKLKTKLEASQLSSKKDAVDILNDMSDKVRGNQPVPNYLMEGLKGLLKDAPEYQSDLEKILSLLTKK